MRNQKGYVAGDNGQAVVTADHVIVGAMSSDIGSIGPGGTLCRAPAASS